jgi:hypothetical protein
VRLNTLFAVATVGCVLTLGSAQAALLSVQLGIPCSSAPACSGGPWVNGYVDPGPGVGNFTSQNPSEPSPFNDFIGSDFDFADGGTDYSGTWTFTYTPFVLGTTINSASILIAIFDHDSSAAGNQVALFSVNGTPLTAELNTLFEGSGGTNFEYNIYTLNLPGSLFPSLLGGSTTIILNLQGPGQVNLVGFGLVETEANGAGVDYSVLAIDYTEPVSEIPEPTSTLLVGGGLLGLALAGRRRKSA